MTTTISCMRMICALALALICVALPAQAQDRNRAPNFNSMSAGAKVVVVPVDLELFSMSGGGILEPRADWTAAATGHVKAALNKRLTSLNVTMMELSDVQMDPFLELNHLHGAVANSISFHHSFGQPLPTKNNVLDWTLGETTKPLHEQTKADYALFTYVRDSYASAERKAMMVVGALVGVGMAGGAQVGYASLVDLRDGRIVWFNRLARAAGDMRNAESAVESVNALLSGFPAQQANVAAK